MTNHYDHEEDKGVKQMNNTKDGHMRVLCIDAWGNSEGGWVWNRWYPVGSYKGDIDNNRQILEFFADFVNDINLCYIADDGYNIVLYVKETHEPYYAIEYGNC